MLKIVACFHFDFIDTDLPESIPKQCLCINAGAAAPEI